MCCFIVPMAQAVATTIYRKTCKASITADNAGPLKRNLPELEKMLWGGTLMLIVDHIINGELTWRAPFFTALNELHGAEVMLKEMLTVGVPMSLALTAAWGIWSLIRESKTQAVARR